MNNAFTELTGYSYEEAVRVTLKNYSKSGEAYWLEMNIFPLKGSDGNVTHFAAIERDVTESKELELSRFFKTDKVFTVLALDIDHFKAVNDKYGHQAGDRVIQLMSDTCRSLFDEIGHVARTGGEEFTILIPDMNAQTAERIAEKLCQAIAELTVGAHDKITSQILARADKTLYEAKDSGRNRVCVDKVVCCDSV